MKPISIVIVDGNSNYNSSLRHAFEDRGYLTWTCPSPEIASSILAAIQPHVAILDLDMEGQNALELIDAWRELAPLTRIVVEIGSPDVRRLREAMDHGASAFQIKSHSLTPLLNYLKEGEISQVAA